jgi:hypothetical protein
VFTRGALKAVLISTGIGMSYIVLIPLLGVILVTPLCMAAYSWYFGLRRWVWIVIVPIVLTAFIYVSFGKFMMVPLPMGFLER